MTYRATIMTLGAALLAGCGGSPSGTRLEPTSSRPPAAATHLPPPAVSTEVTMSSPAASSDELPMDTPAVQAARTEFATSLGIPLGAVQVVSVQEVTWNDGALGCPQPGQSYIQVLTPGYRIVLEAQGQRAEYHTTQGERPHVIRCDQPVSKRPQLDLATLGRKGLQQATQDLETKLGTGTPIAVVGQTIAPVKRLVCGDTVPPGAAGAPAQVILEYHLQAGADIHVYRAWGEHILYCGLMAPTAAPITE